MTGVRFFDFQCAAPKSVSILALFDERLAQAHDEGDKLTDAVRAKLKESGSVAQTGRSVEGFRSWGKLKARVQNPANYARGTTIIFIQNMKGITTVR